MDTLEPNQKKCNFCGESISAEAKRCQYCGSVFDNSEAEALSVENDEAVGTEVSNESRETNTFGNRDFSSQNEENKTGTVNEDMGLSASTESAKSFFSNQPSIQQIPNRPTVKNTDKGVISNGMKVFLTTICTFIPLLGQLAGIIVSIVFMNSGEKDKRSFGIALLIASLITFVISCLLCFVLLIASRLVTEGLDPYYYR